MVDRLAPSAAATSLALCRQPDHQLLVGPVACADRSFAGLWSLGHRCAGNSLDLDLARSHSIHLGRAARGWESHAADDLAYCH